MTDITPTPVAPVRVDQNSPTGAATRQPNKVGVTENVPVKYTYAILQETNMEEGETWLTFIRYQGNEEALAHLEKQLESVDWYVEEGLSTFDLEIKYLVSEQTAKEMSKVDLNHCSYHRKFDGKLEKINLGLKEAYKTKRKMSKVFDVLGYRTISDFVDNEDIDPEDLAGSDEEETETESESEENSESESQDEPKSDPKKQKGKMPAVVAKKQPLPGFAKAKAKRRKR